MGRHRRSQGHHDYPVGELSYGFLMSVARTPLVPCGALRNTVAYTQRATVESPRPASCQSPTQHLPDLDRARTILEDFARFWDAEPNPAERRKLLLSLFAQVWAKDNRIVAVKPNTAFADYFTVASEVRATHPKADADDEATKAGATGVEPCPDTADRVPRLAGFFSRILASARCPR